MEHGLTLLEFPSFTEDADELFTKEELEELRTLLAYHPEAGNLITGTGGVRKLRWTVEKKQKGKRGGARVIYYFHSPAIPLALLAVYAKGEKIDLTAAEKKELRALVKEYVASCQG